MQHPYLHILGKRGGKALQIQLLGVPSHRLHKELMPLFVGKAYDLILNAGAVARAGSVNPPGVQGRTAEILPNHPMRIFVGIDDVTGNLLDLIQLSFVGPVGKGRDLPFPFLKLQF